MERIEELEKAVSDYDRHDSDDLHVRIAARYGPGRDFPTSFRGVPTYAVGLVVCYEDCCAKLDNYHALARHAARLLAMSCTLTKKSGRPVVQYQSNDELDNWLEGVVYDADLETHLKNEGVALLDGDSNPSPPSGKRDDWSPPAGFVGTKTIGLDAQFQKKGKNPPRTTIDVWINVARKNGSVPTIVKAPDSGELYLPESWVLDQISRWNPRERKQPT